MSCFRVRKRESQLSNHAKESSAQDLSAHQVRELRLAPRQHSFHHQCSCSGCLRANVLLLFVTARFGERW